jgi:hypothetical protein
MRLTVLAAALLALAACQPKDAATKASEKADKAAGAMGQDAPNATAPTPVAVKPVSFDPQSKTAEAVTGAISLAVLPQAGPNSAPSTRLGTSNGSVYETELIPGGAEQAAKAIDWSKVFGTTISFDPKAPADIPSVDLHSINLETISPKAPNGGFCGKDKTGFIAMAIPITTPTGVTMSIAAFKGDVWPPKDASGLCGVYTYNAPH